MKIKTITCMTVLFAMLFACVVPCFAAERDFESLIYPNEALTQFSPEMLNRISTGDDYIANRGYDETGLYISPYWTMTVNGESVPVYASPVYDWPLDRGVLQSFQYLYMNDGAQLQLEMSFSGGAILDAGVLPERLNGQAIINGNRLSSLITSFGDYTFLINGESQEYAVTVFVREKTDEDAEIARLTEKYGENGVAVYEKGYYSLESLPLDKNAVYFKRGSFVSVEHKTDIRSAEDASKHTPYPFADISGKDGAVITGCGTFDFTKTDRGERSVMFNVNFCRNTRLEGLICLNPASWTVGVYGSENCTLDDITVFGYRTNSDGINIISSNGITVTDSFCRNGDDSFSVKALNTDFECHGVTFTNCIGWSNKARCFGVTGEVERDIYDIRFSGCSVICRNAVWDTDRTGSLVIAVETGNGSVHDVIFEDIEIHKDDGRPIYCMVYGDGINNCRISGIQFRNIRMNADGKIKISSQREISSFGKFCAKLNGTFLGRIRGLAAFFSRFYNASNSVEVSFENVSLNGKKLTSAHSDNFDAFGNAKIKFVK